ncbi:hypothetical protein PoB_005885200 [Plakobranchus ocellatus]|uniref:Uncharacterized protein n=1 Tax=Plakobranchus ocellatus TaxID=259542 RepID=A0AAV4CL62_9GAST|nr:hypothetical protein PoB_005885200 [Plakobranchus ocellatus]
MEHASVAAMVEIETNTEVIEAVAAGAEIGEETETHIYEYIKYPHEILDTAGREQSKVYDEKYLKAHITKISYAPVETDPENPEGRAHRLQFYVFPLNRGQLILEVKPGPFELCRFMAQHKLEQPIGSTQDNNNSTLSIRAIHISTLYIRDSNNSTLSIRAIHISTLYIRDNNNSTLSIRDISNSMHSPHQGLQQQHSLHQGHQQ